MGAARWFRRDLLSAAGAGAMAALAGCTGSLSAEPFSTEWEVAIPRTTASFSVSNDAIVLASEAGVYMYDAESGDETGFNGHINDPVYGRPVVSDGVAFYGTIVENTVYAVDQTGSVEWNTRLPGSVTSCARGDGLLYAATNMPGDRSGVYALDVASGDEIWGIDLEGDPIASSPTVAQGRVFVESNGVVAFDAESGNPEWRTTLPGNSEVGEAARHWPVVDGSRIHLSRSGSGFVVLDSQTGDERWRVRTLERLSKPAVRDDVAYVGTTTANRSGRTTFYAFDIEEHTERWTTPLGEISIFGPAISAEFVYTAVGDTLYAMDRESGEIDWEYEFDRSVSHPILDGDRLYLTGNAASGHRLYALTID